METLSVMLVGGDRLEGLLKCLDSHGMHSINHISGRKKSEMRKLHIPAATSLVVVLVDYINHMTVKHVKDQAKAQGIPVLFTRNSSCILETKLAVEKIKLTEDEKRGDLACRKINYCRWQYQ